MRAGVHAIGTCPGNQKIEATTPIRGRGRAIVETDGLLLEGSTLVCREGRYDLLRQVTHSRAR
jgi:hypothetical protein